MSIAVSAVIAPSRLLALMTLSMCTGSVVIGGLIAAGAVGEFDAASRVMLALACIGPALHAARDFLRSRHWRLAQRIDISGSGHIRLTSVTASGGTPAALSKSDTACAMQRAAEDNARLFHLLPSSTLWSGLMVLDLRADDGMTAIVIVLPDTMTQTSFRALSVACHWIAAHNIRAADENS